jgi:murein DD-endopeptidase MepM/ murein hydrolase activator NlpD
MRSLLAFIFVLALVMGCARPGEERPQQENTRPAAPTAAPSSPTTFEPPATIAPTASATAVPTATPAPTATATPIPTPTPTAVPMGVTGSPRAVSFQTPEAQEGTSCGLVDLFDFPLDPPHGRDARGGGSDFGIWRSRFDGYHAGEDWWISGGGGSQGASVYSIGHGEVTYAEPLGWGRDKGVVIVRHTFPDGHELLSFYGHLDEDSLKVEAGDCVRRGEKIGEIGRPTTGPHLHFELRTYMPYAPGRGYMPDDPTLAGWVPPSETVWHSRLAASPGVLWTQPASAEVVRTAETAQEKLILLLDGEHIRAIDMTSGEEVWRRPVGEDIERLMFDRESGQIYTANQKGEVLAYALPDSEGGITITGALPLWAVDFDVVGIPTLMPLPGGGLVLSAWDHLVAISASGEFLWEVELETRPYDWLLHGETLFVTANGVEWPLLTANRSGWQFWDTRTGGRLATAGDQVLLYDGERLYRLDLAAESVEPLLNLPGGRRDAGDVAPLPGGGLIVAHVDRADRRLLAFDSGGNLLWQRSVDDATAGDLRLFAAGDKLFLVDKSRGTWGSEIALFALDLEEEPQLLHLFSGGSRSSALDQTSITPLAYDQVLINIDGRSLTLLDTAEAERIVSSD